MTTKSKELKLHEKLIDIQVNFKSNKSRYNSFGKYNFRSAEDILEALKPFEEKHGVYFKVNESFIGDSSIPIIESVASISDGEESIEAIAIVGVDLNQKGMQVPQQFGAASSYGKKYALGNLLLIDDTQDSDATNTHGKDKKSPTPKAEDSKAKDIPESKLGSIRDAINKGTFKKDKDALNKALNTQGFRDLTDDEFNSL